MLFLPFKILTSPILLPAFLFIAGFAAFKLNGPACGHISESAHIFVLTGDARRIPFAVEKLRGYPNRRLYIIGAGTPAFETEFGSQIAVESESKTTFENAVAIRKIAVQKLLANIVVITTEDHIQRAVFLIRKQAPYLTVTACSAPLSKMNASKRLERWAQEYIKFIGTVIGIEHRA